MPDHKRHAYIIRLTDVASGEDVIAAAVDLSDEQRQAFAAHVARLTGASATKSETIAARTPRASTAKPEVERAAPESRFKWNWPGRITSALMDGNIVAATRHFHRFAGLAPKEALHFLDELRAGHIHQAVALNTGQASRRDDHPPVIVQTFIMAVARGPKR